MKKWFLCAVVFLLCAPFASAQFVAVSASVKDSNGNVYAGCRGDATFVPNPSGTTQPLLGGSVFPTDVVIAQCDAFGGFTLNLADVAQVTPSGGTWKFNLRASDGTHGFSYTAPVCPNAGCVTGSSLNITSAIQTVAPLLSPLSNPLLNCTPTSVVFSATETFDASSFCLFQLTLTGNVTSSTIINPVSGRVIQFEITQNGTGGNTFAWPVSVLNPPVMCGAANCTSRIELRYNGTNWVNPSDTVSNLTVSGTATVGKLNGVCVIDGVKYTTLAAAFGDAGCQVIDDSGFLSGGTIASTITFPARAVHLTLGVGPYTGPASGSAFVINDFHSNGSSIVGQGITGGESPNRLPVTVIKTNGSNTSPLIALGEANTSGIVQGVSVSQLMLDGNSSATNCMTWDSVENGYFDNLDCENTTGTGLSTVVSGSIANNGVQFNRMLHWKFNNVNGCASFDGNSGKTSDFTQNYLWDWTCNFTGTGNPGLEFIAGDSNWLYAIRSFRSGGSAYDIKFDAVQASHLGGLANEVYGFHGNPTNTIDCEFAVTGGGQANQVLGYSVTENQSDPLINGNGCLNWTPTGIIGNPGTYSGPRGETPSIFSPVQLFSQAASIASTPIGTTTATANGVYEIHYWIQTAQAGTTSGSVTTQFTWTDGLFGSGPANIPSPANVVGDVVSGTIEIRSGSSVAVNYSTTYSSVGATPYQYEIKIVVEYKG